MPGGWSAVCECGITCPYTLLYIDSDSENIKTIFLSETARPRALIFGKEHHLVDNIYICSNYGSATKHDPHGGSPGAWPVSNKYL